MCNLICKALHRVKSTIRNSPTHYYICFTQIQSFSSSFASIDQTKNQHSFTVNYLINSCGFPLEKAITTSKKISFETPEKPDSVIAFLCSHGFTKTQASNVIFKYPRILSSKPEKTLLPKLEFFKSKGFSSTNVVKILSTTPELLQRSLQNQIIPSFEFVKNLIGSEERTLSAIKQFAGRPLLVDFESRMLPNVDILREVGVPDAKVAFLLTCQPRAFKTSCERFRQIVEEVKGMGFNPMRVTFVIAVQALSSMSKPVWEKKIEVYKKWGLSEDEILVAFGKYPWFMMVSEDKITRIMDFLVNKMGLDSSYVLKRPQLLSMSFEKRIVPRCLVYQALQAKGLIKRPNISLTMLRSTEMWFVQKFVNLAKEEAPDILKLYEEKFQIATPSSVCIAYQVFVFEGLGKNTNICLNRHEEESCVLLKLYQERFSRVIRLSNGLIGNLGIRKFFRVVAAI
ncbi:transcription termination factor MTERF15, mitochondrial-like [Rhododendron vialii]|uniref:transcription termination factor MTERF15, mitochondrial-like n=1 Tax=Rhododendron vialii TaxID=182163 RepID=UPI00265ED2A5|nr:transcription termination factor MTERF15, mitochondrial-like [Rhododendron vialii]